MGRAANPDTIPRHDPTRRPAARRRARRDLGRRQGVFISGPGTRKSQNLAHNANCVISMSLKGIDLILEGGAEGNGRQNAPAAGGAVCGPGLAGNGQGRRVHLRIQRAQRGSATMGPLRGRADHGLWGADGRARRGDPLALQILTSDRRLEVERWIPWISRPRVRASSSRISWWSPTRTARASSTGGSSMGRSS